MGMAASQARFLGLTARKTNLEYEGQQINQQRTALSNQSANYYNDLLGMSVPVPPSVDNYTKTVYSFEDGALTNTITSMIANPNGSYTVSYLRQWVDDFSAVSAATSVITRNGGNYFIGATQLRVMSDAGTKPNDTIIKNDPYLSTLEDDQLDGLMEEEKAYIELLNDKYNGGQDADWYVRYVQDTTTGEWTPFFYKVQDVNNAQYSDTNGASLSNIPCYTIGSEQKQEEVKAVADCKVEKDSTGRYISISIPDANGQLITYALTTSTTTDQAAYDDAMNQYEYEKYQYDQAIDEINAKIEIVQAEDKNLELRLKQLDTEQDAISTEMDAVSKVIEKNVESTFKTFG